MIFEELTLHDYAAYRGRQTMNLLPRDRKPVVLVGGLNGAGKTSLLDGLQLALYGPLASLSSRRGLAYDKFLQRSINRQADALAGASVELAFRVQAQGELQRYRVRRTWATSGGGYTRENVEIYHNDRFDKGLSERWSEQAEAFLPRGIAPLFFFDAEQIESFAAPDTSRALLGTALRSLLGLDLVERLTDDLAVLQKRTQIGHSAQSERTLIEQLEKELQTLKDSAQKAASHVESAVALIGECERELAKVSDQFRESGGDLYESRRTLEVERDAARSRLDRIAGELRDLAEGPSCFFVVSDMLALVEDQAKRELASARNERLLSLLTERDDCVIDGLRRSGLTPKSLGLVAGVLAADRDQRAPREPQAQILSLGEGSTEGLLHLMASVRDQARLRSLLAEHEREERALIAAERKLEGVPEEASIARLQAARAEALSAMDRARGTLAAAEERFREAQHAVDEHDRRLRKAVAEVAERQIHQEEVARILIHAGRVSKTLDAFKGELTRQHLGRLEAAILGSLQQLLRKQRLITGLHISPEDFSVQLQAHDDKPISPEQLSAGERQLLAVSTLWGLAKVSGRALPVIVDTPLGRLDATHRRNLVQRYFPYASHQVILLSTDDEIDHAALQDLRPFVGRTYQLMFEEASATTRIEEGYFC